jgi:ABC-type uncharacterized transport system substrate-binding protein
VWQYFKRLALGVILISFSAGILLFSDWNRRSDHGRARENLPPHADKPWKMNLLYYVDSPAFEEARDGVMKGFQESGLVENQDFTIVVRNGQGDMATTNSMVDVAAASGLDLLLTLSTPMLQAAMNRAGNLPIVFSVVANPILAGAGISNEHHRPTITGIYTTSDFQGMMQVLPLIMPQVRRIGTLFVPSEINSVFYKDLLTEAAQMMGVEVIAVGVSSTAEVVDGALALTGKRLDAICQISDNLTSAAFVSILRAAKQANLPLFSFQSSHLHDGAVAVIARDFEDAGREAAYLAIRILQGESPATIPFQPIQQSRLMINLEAAKAAKLTVPISLRQRADVLLGTP